MTSSERWREEMEERLRQDRRRDRRTAWFVGTCLLIVVLGGVGIGYWGGSHHRREDRARVFMTSCLKADFTPKQCGLLFALAEDAADRADESTLLSTSALAISAISLAK